MDILSKLDRVVTSGDYHDFLTLVKGARNGAVYGAKVRFSHALVTALLFRRGSLKRKLQMVVSATKEHAINLGTFVFIYKAILLALSKATKTPGSNKGSNAFIAGLLGGYYVFGRGGKSGVNQQIVLYVFSRVILGIAKGLVKRNSLNRFLPTNATPDAVWCLFASTCWGLVMYMFATEDDILQPSLRGSMVYLYRDSDSWDGLKTLLWHNM
ncbi:Tim17/Tim22/Tim23/Pmp24 family-domain-containing protein [Dipodascopsis tothii]|uniref:Tim17/Tim22/Tim23/Pmp24 family-domain-containing protein n=1 Tax=Dipodascopsis tothii TaxID=44089 RepID=UPI0034CE08FB